MNYFHYWKTLRVLYTKAFRNYLSRNKSDNHRRFLIMGRARSGTTLLHTYLNAHPHIYSAGEIDTSTVLDDLAGTDIKQKSIFGAKGAHIKAAGAKVLLPVEHAHPATEILQRIISLAPCLSIIYLHRQNLLREYVSLKIAEKTNRWSEVGQSKILSIQDKQIEINLADMHQYFSRARESLQHYRHLFGNTPYFELSFEDLVDNPQEKLYQIHQFLQVKPAPAFSLLQRQNPEPIEALIKNYPSIEAELTNTSYQSFLAPIKPEE